MRGSYLARVARWGLLPPIVGAWRTVLTLLPVLLLAREPFAGAQEVKTLTEQEFLERFESTDARFRSLDARAEAAAAEIAAAKVLPNPTLAFDREEVFPSGGSLPENFARLQMPIEISGRRSRRIAAAEAAAQAARDETERDQWVLRLEALEVFHDAALARLDVETLRAARQSLYDIAQAMAARARAGDVSEYDRDRIEVELTTHDDLLGEAEARLSLARRTLAVLVGDDGARYDASDALAIPALPAAPAGGAADPFAARADYRAAGKRVRQADEELRAARRAWIPNLTVSGGWKSTDTGSQVADGYLAGLGVNVPLFDHGQAERAAALAQRRAAESQLQFLSVQVPLAIENARDELTRAVERASAFEQTQLPRLDQLLRSAEASYGAGEHSAFELLDAYRTARETRLHALELRRAAKRREVELWRALGARP